jgi:hypothetical protein
VRSKLAKLSLVSLWLGAFTAIFTALPADSATPFGQPMSGNMTWYNDVGNGACGSAVDASSQLLVAVSPSWWTTANPNDDPLCQGVSVQVSYNGMTITVPVADKCASCSATHIDLSEPAFAELAPLSLGNVSGITWQFVQSSTTPAPPPPPAPSSTASSPPSPPAPVPSSPASSPPSPPAPASPPPSCHGWTAPQSSWPGWNVTGACG